MRRMMRRAPPGGKIGHPVKRGKFPPPRGTPGGRNFPWRRRDVTARRGFALASKVHPRPRMISLWRSLRRFGVAGLAFTVLSILAALAAAEGLLDPTALVITLGGSLGVLSVTFSRRRLGLTWNLLGEALTMPPDPEETIAVVKRLGQ